MSEMWHQPPLDRRDAAGQVAASQALLLGDTPVTPTLRWYIAAQPALIRGVFQPESDLNAPACAARGIPIIRRRSGGTAVLVGPPFLSCDIALPPGHLLAPPDVTTAYRWLGETWLQALSGLGVAGARLVTVEEVRANPYRPPRDLPPGAPLPDEALVRRACFGSLSSYELAVGGRKLVGLSQVRRRAGVLFQVGVPLRWEADLLAALLAHNTVEQTRLARLLRGRACGLADVLAPMPPVATIIAAFEAALAARWSVELAMGAALMASPR